MARLDSATGVPREEKKEEQSTGDFSFMSSTTDSNSHYSHPSNLSSSIVSYRMPGNEGLFRKNYEPFSLEGLQRKHNSEMSDNRDHGCIEKRNDSKAMINALKSLQEKVRALELEREAAATRYERMREDTAEHLRLASTPLKRSQVRKERREQDDHDLKLSQKADSNAAILKAQLSNQDRELHYLREVLQKTEKDKLDLQAHNEELIRQQSELEEKELRLKSTEQQRQPSRAPLHQFEEETGQVGDQRSPPVSDFTPLKPIGSHSNQHLAEIREDYDGLHGRLIELEKKLKREQMERHRIQNDYSLLQSLADVNSALVKHAPQKERPTASAPSGRTRTRKKTAGTVQFGKPKPTVHYRLDLRDVPFVLGTSTGESHSVITNCQKAISLMKMHSRTLCGAIAASSLERSASQDRLRAQQKLKQQKKAKKKLRGTRPVSVSGGVNACDFLKDMSHYEDRDLRSLEETTSPVKKNFNVLKNVKQLQSSLKKDDLMWE